MKIKSLKIMGLFSLIALLMYGCGSNKPGIPDDIRIGYAEYKACLKECNEKEAQYTTEYNNCKTHCPNVYPELCDHLFPENKKLDCIEKNSHPDPVCLTKCEKEYQDHLAEIAKCRQDCLDTYNKRFEVLEQ